MLDVAPSISESRYFFFRMAINVFESLAYLLFLFVCLDANSRKTDTKWIAIIITVFIISYYVIHCQIYTWEFFLKAVIIRLVTFVKNRVLEGYQPGYSHVSSPASLHISWFSIFTMLFMKIFATNINKPYTIIETQMRVLGMMFCLCLRMWVIKLQMNFPLLYSKGMPMKCTIVSSLPALS